MQVYLFFTNHCITTFTFLMYILVSLEVSFNVSCSFGHDDVNQLWCFEVLIWLKIDYFWKYLRTYKSKKKKDPFKLDFNLQRKMGVHKTCFENKFFFQKEVRNEVRYLTTLAGSNTAFTALLYYAFIPNLFFILLIVCVT